MPSEEHTARVWHRINGKHVAAAAVGLMWTFLSSQSPGPVLEPFMPWALPVAFFVSAVLAYIFLDFMLPNYGKDSEETTGGKADAE